MTESPDPWEYTPPSRSRTVASHLVTACVSAAIASALTAVWLRRNGAPPEPGPYLEVHELPETEVAPPAPEGVPEEVVLAPEPIQPTPPEPAPETPPVEPAPAEPTPPVPGQAWEIPAPKMTFAWLPPGECLIGSSQAEREWVASPEGRGRLEFCANEGTEPRAYTLERGFWLGQTEVTVAQWRVFVDDTEYLSDAEKMGRAFCWSTSGEWSWVEGKSWREPNWHGVELRDDHPVACIAWNDGVAFCKWLTERNRTQIPEDYEFRLPGEAEWEYACRGGRDERSRFWWGDRLADGQGRANMCSADMIGYRDHRWNERVWWRDGYAWAAPVDSFGPLGRNEFGLADTLGNVWEWCYDYYTPDGAKTTIHIGDEDDAPRVLRGGAFNVMAASTRCAKRAHNRPTHALSCYGFRVCLGKKIRR